MKWHPWLFATFALALALSTGCGGPETTPPAPEPVLPQETPETDPYEDMSTGELVDKWQTLANAGRNKLDPNVAVAITAELARRPNGLDPLLNILGDAETDPVAKMLAVISLNDHVSEDIQDRLVAMTQPERETTTRVCAAHLLGRLDTAAARKRLQELRNDEERRVRVEAELMLVMQREPEALDTLREAVWDAPGTTAAEKEQLVLFLPPERAEAYRDIYIEAATDETLSVTTRTKAIDTLGRLTHPSVAEALRTVAEKEPVPKIRNLAQVALEAVEARLEEQGQAPPGEAPEHSGADHTGAQETAAQQAPAP